MDQLDHGCELRLQGKKN